MLIDCYDCIQLYSVHCRCKHTQKSKQEVLNLIKCFDIGKHDGQTMMVRQVDCVEAYQWSASESRWVKVGNVVGGSNDSQTTSGHGKTHFEGKVQISCLCFLLYTLVFIPWPFGCIYIVISVVHLCLAVCLSGIALSHNNS